MTRLIIRSQAETGLCALALAILAGRNADPPGRAGLAHLVEHLVLKPGRRPGNTERFVVNAFTTGDVTVFETMCLPADADDAVAVLLGVFDPLRAGEQELDLERQIVEVEAGGVGGPYDHPASVIGPHAERNAISPADVSAFHSVHYRPEHAAIGVAGEVSSWFADRIGTRLPAPAPLPLAAQVESPVRLLERTPDGQTHLSVAPCNTPGYATAAVAFAVLAGAGPQPFQVTDPLPNRSGALRPGRTGSRLSLTGVPCRTANLDEIRVALKEHLMVLREDPVAEARSEAIWGVLHPGGLNGLVAAIERVDDDAVAEIIGLVAEVRAVDV